MGNAAQKAQKELEQLEKPPNRLHFSTFTIADFSGNIINSGIDYQKLESCGYKTSFLDPNHPVFDKDNGVVVFQNLDEARFCSEETAFQEKIKAMESDFQNNLFVEHGWKTDSPIANLFFEYADREAFICGQGFHLVEEVFEFLSEMFHLCLKAHFSDSPTHWQEEYSELIVNQGWSIDDPVAHSIVDFIIKDNEMHGLDDQSIDYDFEKYSDLIRQAFSLYFENLQLNFDL